MDDTYAINLAKTEYREAFNTGDVERLLSVFAAGFTDMSVGIPSFFGEEARTVFARRYSKLFQDYGASLAVSIIAIRVYGSMAYDYGWHELTLTPKAGGQAITTRQRYFEVWQREADGKWKIGLYIDNMDLPAAMPDVEFRLPQTRAMQELAL